jgi:hypothetical protein
VLDEEWVNCLPAEVSSEESDDSDPDDEGLTQDEGTQTPEERRHPDLPEEVFTPIERQGTTTPIPEDEEVQHASAQVELLA